MTSILEQGRWQDAPPPPRSRPRRKSQWDAVVEALKADPAHWLSFDGQSRSVPDYIRDRFAHLPALVVEAREDKRAANGQRRVVVWMCWEPKGSWNVETETEPEPEPEPEPEGDAA